jgi:transcriptional regulator with XRE-family HTH domain
MTSDFHENFEKLTQGRTNATISTQTGIDESSISRYRNGSRLPSLKRLRLLAEKLDVSTDELLGVQRSVAKDAA